MLSWVKLVHLPCLRIIAVRIVPGCCFLAFNFSSCVCGRFTKFLHCVFLALRGRNVRANRWFRQARQPLLTACGRMAKSARCCSPRPSRRFAKRAVEEWALHSQGSALPLSPHVAEVCTFFFFSFFPLHAHAVVCSMFPVFLA